MTNSVLSKSLAFEIASVSLLPWVGWLAAIAGSHVPAFQPLAAVIFCAVFAIMLCGGVLGQAWGRAGLWVVASYIAFAMTLAQVFHG